MKRLAILADSVLLAGCAVEEEDKKSEQKPIRRTTTGAFSPATSMTWQTSTDSEREIIVRTTIRRFPAR
jgi:hypothetical protein